MKPVPTALAVVLILVGIGCAAYGAWSLGGTPALMVLGGALLTLVGLFGVDVTDDGRRE